MLRSRSPDDASMQPGIIRPIALAVALTATAVAPPILAQTPHRVDGRIVDAETGGPVAGAEVRLEGPRSAAVLSGNDGRWRIESLTAGRYHVRTEHLGYIPAEREIVVDGDRVTIEVALTPRAVRLDQLVVTASRHSQRLKDVPVTTELVTREAIRRTGAADLSAVLIEQTGIAPEGGHPAGAGVMLQGLGSERVLVLLDGQPFIGRIAGHIDVSRIPTSMIDRVEVVKGPQSTLYGSEAMGGVVNVITRRPDSAVWTGGARIAAGTEGRRDVSAHLLGGTGPFAVLGDIGHRRIELTPGRSERTGALSLRRDGLGKLRWSFGDAGWLEAAMFALDERQRWRSGQLYHFADNLQAGARLGSAWTSQSQTVTSVLYATEFDHLSRRATSPEPVPGTGDRERQRLLEAEVIYSRSAGRSTLVAGIEASREAIHSDRVEGRDRTLDGVEPFAQYTWAFEHGSLVPGVRLSWSEQWGTYWTPRLATLYQPHPDISVRASIGRGYRAPDFKELHMSFLNIGPGYGYAVRGNPGLEPETSTNLTASIEWAPGAPYVRAQAFHNRFDGFIETRTVGDSSGITLHSYGNIDEGRTQGVELEVGGHWQAIRLEAGYALLDAVHSASDEPLLGRPRNSARASMGYTTPFGPRVHLTALYTGATPTQRTEAGILERGGFTRLDARLVQHLPNGFEVAFGTDNLLDDVPTDWPGYAGRRFDLSLSWEAPAR